MAGLGAEKNKQLDEFARMIEEENKIHNLTRIVGLEAIRVRHFEDSLAVLGELEKLACGKSLSIMDIGSGAGLPGLAIAIARPDWKVVSVDATGKKVRFQQKAVNELGLMNVEVLQGRAEDLGRVARYREKFDAVTARAVGELALLAELAMPLVRVGGKMFAWKGPAATGEIENAKSIIEKMGGGKIEEMPYRLVVEGQEMNYRIVAVEKVKATPKGYPREFKEIAKRRSR